MKKIIVLVILVACFTAAFTQIKSFRFAFISDTHINSSNGVPGEDLHRTVNDINAMTDVKFVVLTGDITELGTHEELKLAKRLLDSLRVPWYIIPGNHDTGWSESGGDDFAKIFGDDKFTFDYNGIRFIGCASGPYVRMSDGHIPRGAISWLDKVLKSTSKRQPVIFLNHYPIDNSLDNWYEITDRLRKYNTIAILCGHGHANKAFNFEDIPGIMGRSNLRAKDTVGGYNFVDVRNDSIIFSERKPTGRTLPSWTTVMIKDHQYGPNKGFVRPTDSINKEYKQVQRKWTYASAANVISTPALLNDMVVFGNQSGDVEGIGISNGKKRWTFKTGGAIYSSPATTSNSVVLGSADGYVYALDSKGLLKWKFLAGGPVLGSPVIEDNKVYIGASDHNVYCLDVFSGQLVWKYSGLNGPVVSTPLVYGNMVICGAWDTKLYAWNKLNGNLVWSWTNGSPVRNYSPASCTPVASEGVVYIVAPDRFISAIDTTDGKTLWRSNEAGARESIGISEDGQTIYAKSMNDTVVAYAVSRTKQPVKAKMNCRYGYDHVPSMLIEKGGQVYFGTRNGLVYSIDSSLKKINWVHKIDNSMVNTVRLLEGNRVVAATMDGKVVMLEVK